MAPDGSITLPMIVPPLMDCAAAMPARSVVATRATANDLVFISRLPSHCAKLRPQNKSSPKKHVDNRCTLFLKPCFFKGISDRLADGRVISLRQAAQKQKKRHPGGVPQCFGGCRVSA
jgi:hypothetical protein